MELTFNLNELIKQDLKTLNIEEYFKINENKKPWEILIKPHEIEKLMISTINITSRDLRKFIDDTFDIDMNFYHSSNRNRLNEIIKKYAPTQRGKRTTLNYFQYRNLILSDEFNEFILKNFNRNKHYGTDKMYNEIMFLQNNRFKNTILYQKEKEIDRIYYAKTLSLIEGLDQIIKDFYWHFLNIWNQKIHYSDLPLDKEILQILDIISYRFKQKSKTVYKFTTKEDVYSTDKNQIIEMFLRDIERWKNEEIK